MAISFQNVAGNLEAPDITKAGGIIAKAISGIGTAGQAIVTGQQSKAANTFDNAVRGASSLDELENINTDGLIKSGADSQTLAAAEGAVRTKQLDIHGKNQANLFASKLDGLGVAVEQIFESNPDLKNTISVDAGNNPTFFKDPSAPTQEEITNKAAFKDNLTAAGITPFRTIQQVSSDARSIVNQFGGTEADAQKLIADNKQRRSEMSTLSAAQQAEVASMESAIDGRVELQLLDIDAQKTAQEASLGFSAAEALEKVKTQPSDVWALVDQKGGDELFMLNWAQFTKAAGIDTKERITAMLTNPDFSGLQPWMLVEALEETTDRVEGGENIDKSDFEENVRRILGDTDRIGRLDRAVQLDNTTKIQKKARVQLGEIEKSVASRRYKGEQGITNLARNARIFSDTVQAFKGEGSSTKEEVPEKQTTVTNDVNAFVGPRRNNNSSNVVTTPLPPQETITPEKLNTGSTQRDARILADQLKKEASKEVAKETISKIGSGLSGLLSGVSDSLQSFSDKAKKRSQDRQAAILKDSNVIPTEMLQLLDRQKSILAAHGDSTNQLSKANKNEILEIQLAIVIAGFEDGSVTQEQLDKATKDVAEARLRNN